MTVTLKQGDCLELMKELPDESVDMVFTSPPYNMRTRIRDGEYTTREKSEHFSKKYRYFDDALPIEDYYGFHKEVITLLLKKSKIVIYNIQIVTGSKEAWFKIIGDFSKDIKDIIVWDKHYGQPAMHEKVLNSCYELLLILEEDKKAGRVITNSYFKRGELNNIWRLNKFRLKQKELLDEHRAVFPISLASRVINNFSKESDTILDPFMGSGTTGVACVQLNRNFIGYEISPDYFKIAEKRIKEAETQRKLNEFKG